MCIHARFTAVYGYIFVTIAVCVLLLLFITFSVLVTNNPKYVFMYICMFITHSEGEDQRGKVANPARGQLAEQGK